MRVLLANRRSGAKVWNYLGQMLYFATFFFRLSIQKSFIEVR